jgi:hypothetical protein
MPDLRARHSYVALRVSPISEANSAGLIPALWAARWKKSQAAFASRATFRLINHILNEILALSVNRRACKIWVIARWIIARYLMPPRAMLAFCLGIYATASAIVGGQTHRGGSGI